MSAKFNKFNIMSLINKDIQDENLETLTCEEQIQSIIDDDIIDSVITLGDIDDISEL